MVRVISIMLTALSLLSVCVAGAHADTKEQVAKRLLEQVRSVGVDRNGEPHVVCFFVTADNMTGQICATRVKVGNEDALRLFLPLTLKNLQRRYRAYLVVDDTNGVGQVAQRHVLHFAWPIARDPFLQY